MVEATTGRIASISRRPEDDSAMPPASIGFTPEPAGFFARNSANGVPPSAKAATDGGCCR